MANLTGQLGTKDAQPGSIELGVGPASAPFTYIYKGVLGSTTALLGKFELGVATAPGAPTPASTALTVHETITSVVLGQHFQTVIQTVSVAESITKTGSSGTATRVTQNIVEVVYSGVVTARVTQVVVEVAYKKATSASVTDSITVTSTPTTQFVTYRKTVTNAITLTESIVAHDTGDHKAVSDAVVVSETITKVVTHGSNISITVHDSIGVSEAQAARNSVIRLSVVTTIAVAVPETDRDSVKHLSVSNTVQITETVSLYEPIKHLRVTDTILVSQTVMFKEPRVHITVISNITVTDTALGISNRPLKRVTDTITVTPRINFFTGYFTVTDTVNVGSVVAFKRTPIRLTVSDPIVVGENLGNRNRNLRVSYQDDIFIPQFYTNIWPATSRISPNRQTVTDTITTGLAIAGGSPIQHQSVTTNVLVTTVLKQNRFFLSVFDTITTGTRIAGGSSIRSLTVSDALHPIDDIQTRRSPNKQSVTDVLRLIAKHDGLGPRVYITVNENIHINEQFGSRTNFGKTIVTDTIRVGEPLANHGTVRASYTDGILIREIRRANAPRRLTVTDSITVTSRPKLLSQKVKDTITLAEERHRVYVQSVTDTVHVTQAVAFRQVIVRKLQDAVTVTPLVIRAGVFIVNVADTMIIPESQYLLSINGGVISLPGARGTLVSNMLTLTSGKGAIVLPAAQLGNQRGNVETVTVQRSMNAVTVTLVKSSDREKLKLNFRIGLKKSFELRTFIITNISEIITLTNWDGDVWVGHIMNNPFEQTHAGRSAPVEGEFANVEVDFEGVKS